MPTGKRPVKGRRTKGKLLRSGLENVTQGFDHLIGGLAPSLRGRIYFFERMNNIGIVERYVRFAERGAVSGIKSGVPLLIFIAEPDHYEIGVQIGRASCRDRE